MVNRGDCIMLENDREFLCFDGVELDGKQYLFLISVEEPTDICFAEQAMKDGEVQVRVIGNQEEKMKLAATLQHKVESNALNN